MTIHVALAHETRYRYDRPIQLGPQTIRLRPTAHSRTTIESYALSVQPAGHFLNWQQDPFGNFLARVVFPEKVTSFVVRVDLVADMAVHNPFDFFLEPAAETFPFEYDAQLRLELAPCLHTLPAAPALTAWLAAFGRPKPQPTIDFLVGLNQQLASEIGYVVRMEAGIQTPQETLTLKRGSCRDSSWLLVQILRHLGIAARFVSGYLIQLTPDVKSLDGPSGTTHDFTDLHAWAEVYLPGAGWIGLDPTSGLLTGEGHIPLACAPQAVSAAPISGALEKSEIDFDFSMSVTRIAESPRVTKPYSDAQWHAIDALGHRLDAQFKADDVRVTIGGEPTFVSIDYPDDAEWNTTATGPNKRILAAELIERLRLRFAPNGLLHFGQGKWYPGEQLPRWAFGLYWRGDGKPLWRDPVLVADEAADYAPTTAQARAFCEGVARRLDLPVRAVTTAYEDPWYFAAAERRLPENVDPLDNKLDDPMARARLARVFERNLSEPVGFVLPVQRWQARDEPRSWVTEQWSTRSKRLFVVPGESPVGYRLPLPSLPHLAPSQYPHIVERDPFEQRGALPPADEYRQPFLAGDWTQHDDRERMQTRSEQNKATADAVRTALVVEARDGRLNVFMPPVEMVEDYLDLLAAVEDTAAELLAPIHLEGYGPPEDPRLNVIRVTPDPGVIEVNIHPSHSWDEMVATTHAIYEEARLTRLGTEKFMIDGRHTGTGGGNHVVLGAATPADSPFLRRPDLLASLIAYWQHHPALSYLFSGMFIGPTSQAPRVDEARHDGLFELELAFTEVPDRAAGTSPPWLVDRIFRNLLVDVTGNTHRSEICIDKLYSPDSATGRLGLVEFRAFEMPPHAQMSLAQQQLLLALVARFWQTPYQGELVRWGTQLHDRFLLPHYVWRDLCDVVADLNRAGYPLDADWFAPHFEFRFPFYGDVRYGDINLELRQALEPWHVMGEEGAPGGTVRYVDSSLERLQVRVQGMAGERFVVSCNGMRVPLQATGTQGEFVGGVRFRAWRPTASLHPTIEVDAPLVFDIYDRWSGRAVAGCTYHVAHPGGRNFEDLPVNSYAAESRRLSRFFPFGHTPGASPEPKDIARREFPHTLDLRWSGGGQR